MIDPNTIALILSPLLLIAAMVLVAAFSYFKGFFEWFLLSGGQGDE